MNEARYSRLTREFPERAAELFERNEEAAIERYNHLVKLKELYAEDTAQLETSPYANLFLNDLTRDMPSCYIAAAEYDPLKDDSTALATILEEYGIPHRFEMFEGVIHAFLHYTKMLDEANLALEHGAEHFRQQMGC